MKTANIRNKKTSEERKGSAAAQESVAVIFIKKNIIHKTIYFGSIIINKCSQSQPRFFSGL